MPSPATKENRWTSMQRRLGQRLSQQLFDEIAKHSINLDEPPRARKSWGLWLAYVLTTLVYLTSIAFGVVGIALLVTPGLGIALKLFGGFFLLICALSRPRFSKPPTRLISRTDYPMLFKTSDRIAQALRTKPIAGVGISAEFNANYRNAGWKGKPYVEVGAPLLAILSVDELIAMLSHELSHGANGDPLRGRFLYGALEALVGWASAIHPTSIMSLGDGMPYGAIVSVVCIPLTITALALSEFILFIARGLYLLVLRQSQRAEYLADLLAARVAGTQEMVQLLDKLYLFDVVDTAIQRHALTQPDDPIGNKLLEAVAAIPEVKREKHRDESRASSWQVDSTHPPTALRIDMLRTHSRSTPQTVLSSQEKEILASEITRLVESMKRQMTTQKIEAMYF
jgi:Zn-dependent protease with chaperone function